MPVYNEAFSLPDVLERSARVAQDLAESWEILVVDDGSTDETPQILKAFAAREPRLHVLTHARNLGIAASLRKVFLSPRQEWIFFISGDGQIPPEELSRLLPHTEYCDLIYGWRKNRADPLRRRLTAWVYNVLISLCLGRRVHDVDSAILFRRPLFDGVQLQSSSIFIHTELLIAAIRRGLRYGEVPIKHRPRLGGRAAGGRPGAIIHTMMELMLYVLKRKKTL